MVTIKNAENALKSVYLGVIANQLNTKANPLLAKIKQTDSNIWGKDIIKLAPFGINGGIGAGTETGALPTPAGNSYVQFKTALKNLFGRIEISDKAVRASSNAGGAFVNLLADEMEGLGRMVYGDGTGLLAEVATEASAESTSIVVDDARNLIEGMVVDIFDTEGNVLVSGKRVTYVDRQTKTVYLGIISKVVPQGAKLYVQGSKDNEITGLEAIFGNGNLYGLNRTDYPWLNPYVNNASVPMDDVTLQTTIDAIEDKAGSEVDFIACSRGARKAYQQYLTYYRRNIDVAELAGGFKAITFNGIPVVADRFIKEGTAYLLNTKDFALHQLCDWQWLEGEDGKILKQNPGFPSYTATLVKYADLICDRPLGQAKLSNISGTISNPYAEIITAIEAKE